MLSARQKRAPALFILRNRKTLKKIRGVNPIFKNRCKFGAFGLLFEGLSPYPDDFYLFFWMSVNSFNQLMILLSL